MRFGRGLCLWGWLGEEERLFWLAVRVGGRFCDGSGVSYICATREGGMECSQSVSQSINQTCDSCVTLIAVPWFCGVMNESSRFVQVPGDESFLINCSVLYLRERERS